MTNNKKSPAAFIASALGEHTNVKSVSIVDDSRVLVTPKKGEQFVVATASADTLDGPIIEQLVKSEPKPAFVVNIPKAARFNGDALRLAEAKNIAVGGMADLFRAVNLEQPNEYLCANTKFRDRGLKQHSHVSGFTKEFDRCYVVHRRGLPDLRVVFIHEYELTADHVRTAVERYGSFSILVNTDPNARASKVADETAAQLGFPILKWGPFYGRLREK